MLRMEIICRRFLPRSPLWVAALLAGLWLAVELGPQVPVGIAFLDWMFPIEKLAGPGEQQWRIARAQGGLRWLLGLACGFWFLGTLWQFAQTLLTMRCKGYRAQPTWLIALLLMWLGPVRLQRLLWKPGAGTWPERTDWGLLWRLLRPRILRIQRGRVPLLPYVAQAQQIEASEGPHPTLIVPNPPSIGSDVPLEPETDWAALRQLLKPRALELEHRFPRATEDFPRRIDE